VGSANITFSACNVDLPACAILAAAEQARS
jgi:hypothetical protein